MPDKTHTKLSLLRILILLLVTLVLSILSYQVWDSDYSYAYRKYFFDSTDSVQMDFKSLTSMTEAESKRKFPLKWFCRSEITQFGDRFCADELKQWNGMPAMLVVFWFKNDKLTYAKIDIPPWHHEKLATYLATTFGPPEKMNSEIDIQRVAFIIAKLAAKLPVGSTDIDRHTAGLWELQSGAWVMANIKRDQNPLQWNTVFWYSPEMTTELDSQEE